MIYDPNPNVEVAPQGDPPGVTSASPTSDSLELEALQRQLLTIAERLDAYRWDFEQKKDSRCVFTYAYVLITQRIARELPTAGYSKPRWIVELAEAFAQRYVQALEGSAAGGTVSPAWDVVFQAMARKRSSVLEDLIFSMTVHIVHDLPLALVEVGMQDSDGSHIHDFHAVNTAMGEEIDDIKRCIARRYAPYVAWLDQIGRREEDLLTNYGIRMSRGLGWYNATRILDPASKNDALESIERSPQALVAEILNPPIHALRTGLRVGRFLVGLLRRWPKRNLAPPSLVPGTG
jgi:hypothetical protein